MKSFATPVAALLAFLAAAPFANAFELKSYEGRFSVEFPSAPAFQTIRNVGSCIAARHEYRLSERGRVWMASYQDCKPAGMLADIGVNPMLRDFWKGVVKSVGGELRANDPIEHGPLSGRQILVFVPQGKLILRQRMFIEGDRIYQNMYVGPFGTQDDPEVEAFFASFRVMR